ncbi:MAG: CPBP family intramembrane glutamic endopeptidase [Anaerohalosphaeraceae bacterium]
MHRLFNIIAETQPPQSETVVSATTDSFGDPTSIVLCTMGLCVGIIWLFWFDGFGALQKGPTRRCRQRFVFWPLVILVCWIAVLGIFEAIITTDAVSYPASALLEIALIATMLILAQKSFARGLKGFGINGKTLIRDVPWAAINLLGIFPLILFGLWIAFLVGRLFIGTDFSLEVHQTLDTLTDAGMGLKTLVVIFAALIVPIFEELLFRGFFQTSLRSFSDSPWAAIVFTSIFFAILHPPTHIPALFMLSVGLGYAYERSGSLLRPILMHIFFNGLSITMTLLMPQ